MNLKVKGTNIPPLQCEDQQRCKNFQSQQRLLPWDHRPNMISFLCFDYVLSCFFLWNTSSLFTNCKTQVMIKDKVTRKTECNPWYPVQLVRFARKLGQNCFWYFSFQDFLDIRHCFLNQTHLWTDTTPVSHRQPPPLRQSHT